MNIKPLVFKGYTFFENHRHKYKIPILEAGCRSNGFGWGQLSHTLAWVLRVTGLVTASCYAEMTRTRSVSRLRRGLSVKRAAREVNT